DLVTEAREQVLQDALASGMPAGDRLEAGGTGAAAYADAVATYLAFAVSKSTNVGSSLTSWMSDRGAFRETFARQAIPMVWDFAEANPLIESGGTFWSAIEKGAMALEMLPASGIGHVIQADAAARTVSAVLSTDPPYYDNIG